MEAESTFRCSSRLVASRTLSVIATAKYDQRPSHLHIMARAEVPRESVLISLTDVSVDNIDDSNVLRLCLRMTPFSLRWTELQTVVIVHTFVGYVQVSEISRLTEWPRFWISL